MRLLALDEFQHFVDVRRASIGIDGVGTEDNPTSGILLRRGARGTFNNFVINRWRGSGVLLNDTNTQAQATNGLIKMNGLILWNSRLDPALGGPSGDGQTLANNITAGASPFGCADLYARVSQRHAGGRRAEYRDCKSADGAQVRVQRSRFPWHVQQPDLPHRLGAPPDDGFFDQTARFAGGIGDVDWTLEWARVLVETDIN